MRTIEESKRLVELIKNRIDPKTISDTEGTLFYYIQQLEALNKKLKRQIDDMIEYEFPEKRILTKPTPEQLKEYEERKEQLRKLKAQTGPGTGAYVKEKL